MTPTPSKSKFRRFIRWLFIVVGAVVTFGAGYKLALEAVLHGKLEPSTRFGMIALPVGYTIALLFLVLLVISILRHISRHVKWLSRLGSSLFTWRMARRLLAGLVILATLIAVFYAEENWRGKRAWEKCKRDLEAKGEVLDWSAYIPAPIPDEQNIMKAPNMAKWFYKNSPEALSTNSLSSRFNFRRFFDPAKTNNPQPPILIARIVVVPTVVEAKNAGEISMQFPATGSGERLAKFIVDIVGPSTAGSQNLTFVQRSFSQIKPSRVFLQTDQRLSVTDLSQIIPASLVSSNVGHLRVEADVDPSSFRVVLATNPVITAADYLTVSDAWVPELNLIREALKRPQSRLEGDFQRPFDMPTLNFVAIRSVAQVAALRAQCCLLLGRSEQAFHELSLLYELRRFLAGKPAMVVSAMIDVAITGLYTSVIADGLKLHAWREPELIALQKQLHEITLPPVVTDSFRCERALQCQTLQVIPSRKLAEVYSLTDPSRSLWKRITDRAFPTYLLFKFAPRGWIYQNLVTIAAGEQDAIRILNPETQLIEPGKAAEVSRRLERLRTRWSPFTIVASFTLPNYGKAMQATAQNQTLVNQAFVACGLERYRLAHGEYPETLDALVPQFVEKLPRDIIGGQPRHYRRTDPPSPRGSGAASGKFVLYSVGWNETDDGGKPGRTKNGSLDYIRGDWVWETAGR
jgi:hypothetical protein